MNNEIRVISKLGEGSFAEVFKVKNTKTQQIYAVKRLKKRYRTMDEVNKLPEVLYLRAFQGHPNIIKMHEVMFDSKSGYVALRFEIMDVNLYELARDNQKPFNESKSMLLIYQLLKALEFIHSKNVFHRDVKPENCMVDKSTLELKLCDFGSTRQSQSTGPYTEYVSTRWYRAPECILTSGSYGPEVDVWAVGCMLYELLTTRPLFPGKHEIDQITRIHNVIGTPSRDVLAKFRQNPNTQISFSFPQRFPQDLRKLLPNISQNTIELITRLLVYNPSDRVSAHDALEHPAFESFRVADSRWVASGCKIPFAVFYEQSGSGQHNHVTPQMETFVLDSSIKSRNDAPMLINNQQINQQQQVQQHKQPIVMQSKPTIKVNAAAEFSSIEARMKAAQRIREYNQKMMNQKQTKQKIPQFQFGAPSIIKPPNNAPQVFQNPKPELIHPRISHIPPYIH